MLISYRKLTKLLLFDDDRVASLSFTLTVNASVNAAAYTKVRNSMWLIGYPESRGAAYTRDRFILENLLSYNPNTVVAQSLPCKLPQVETFAILEIKETVAYHSAILSKLIVIVVEHRRKQEAVNAILSLFLTVFEGLTYL